MEKRIVVGLGEVLWDMLPSGKQLGGAPSNFAHNVSQLGYPSYAVSAIGDDHLGNEIIEVLKDKPMGRYFPLVPFETGIVLVELDSNGVPSYQIKEDVAWDNIPFTEQLEQIAKRCCCVCFGSLAQRSEVSRGSIIKFLDAMPVAEDTLKVFDINLRQHYYSREVIEMSLSKSNALKINDEEMVVITELLSLEGDTYQDRAMELLRRYNLKLVILTCGTDGSYIFSDSEMSFLDTPKVDVVDTVGAGDSFTAAFCVSWLEGMSLKDAHKRAVGVSAFVCTQNGAMPQFSGM